MEVGQKLLTQDQNRQRNPDYSSQNWSNREVIYQILNRNDWWLLDFNHALPIVQRNVIILEQWLSKKSIISFLVLVMDHLIEIIHEIQVVKPSCLESSHLRRAIQEMVRMDTVVERDTPTPLITRSGIFVLITLSKPTLTASSAYWNLWKCCHKLVE